ncbi:MAG TPA: hypothetical protein VF185_01920 [Patescibacteria group bacterium]
MCEKRSIAIKKLGLRNADLVVQRIMEMEAAASLQDLRILPGPRCHPLSGDRKGQYAVDLVHPKRLVFLPVTKLNEIAESLITEIMVIEIVDYH